MLKQQSHWSNAEMQMHRRTLPTIFCLVVLSAASPKTAAATQYAKNLVTLVGNTKDGIHEVTQDENVAQFIERHGGIPASDEMIESYGRGEAVNGVVIRLYRGKSSIELKIEAGESLFNTVQLRGGDLLRIEYKDRLTSIVYSKVIPLKVAKISSLPRTNTGNVPYIDHRLRK